MVIGGGGGRIMKQSIILLQTNILHGLFLFLYNVAMLWSVYLSKCAQREEEHDG